MVAQERHFRLFDAEEGLNPVAVRALAQDRTDFLWIGTEGGLIRYDGVEMRRWSPDLLDRTVIAVAASPEGPVVALRQGGALFAITAEGAAPVHGATGRPITDARDVTFDTSVRLWIIHGEDLWRRDPGSRWHRIALPLHDQERPTHVRPDHGPGVLLATNRGVWRIPLRTPAERLLELPEIVDLLALPDGRVLVLGFLGNVVEVNPSGAREVLHSAGIILGRAISIAARGSTVWVSIDRYLVSWRSDGTIEVLGADSGIQSGGPLLVDHEGSLWMGSFIGLYQFPEPKTRIWTERSGLPSNHTRFLAQSNDAIWVTTWQGAGYLRADGGKWGARITDDWFSQSRIYRDSRGVLWAGTPRGIVEIEGGRVVRRHGGPAGLSGYHETAEGEIWLGTSRGLFYRGSTEARLQAVAIPPLEEEEPPVEMVLLDASSARP